MHYSDNEARCRVDIFKSGGKWQETVSVVFDTYKGELIRSVFQRGLALVLKNDDGSNRYAGSWAVCLEPYHEHAHPLMIEIPKTNAEFYR